MNANDIALTQVDQLGMLLAQIKDLQDRADAIKDGIKNSASMTGEKSFEGNLFKATYIESNRSVFDSKKFIEQFGAEAYAKFTKTTAVFSVKVVSR
jgi:hypothetical protein